MYRADYCLKHFKIVFFCSRKKVTNKNLCNGTWLYRTTDRSTCTPSLWHSIKSQVFISVNIARIKFLKIGWSLGQDVFSSSKNRWV